MTTDQVLLAMQLLGTLEIAQGVDLARQVEAAIAPGAPAPHPSNAAALDAERAQWAALAADDTVRPERRARAAEIVQLIDDGAAP